MVAVVLAWKTGAAEAQRAPQAAAPAPAANKEAAIRLLTTKGLTPSGRHWLCSEDVRLRRQLDSVDRLQRQLHHTRKALDQRIEENEALGRTLPELDRKIAAQQRLLTAATDPVARRAATEELARLTQTAAAARARFLAPQAFAEDAAVRTLLLEWINARNALAVIALRYEAAVAELNRRYEKLRTDAEIKGALAVLGREHQLGGGRNLAAAAPQIADVKRLALSADAPLYRVSGQWRTSLLLDDATPTACTLSEQGAALVLPHSVAHAANVTIDAKTPKRQFTTADGRQFEVHVIQLKQVRLGSLIISSIEALILPLEGEDVGVLLNRQSLSRQIELQPQRLRLVVR